jgi:hypothetical protein
MTFGELVKYRQQLFVGLSKWNLRGFGTRVALEVFGRNDARVLGYIVDVLANAVEKLLHAIVDLADLATAAVEKIGQGPLSQIQHYQNGDKDDRDARDSRKRPGQLLLDIHDFTCGYL